jgi:hypothetical protein
MVQAYYVLLIAHCVQICTSFSSPSYLYHPRNHASSRVRVSTQIFAVISDDENSASKNMKNSDGFIPPEEQLDSKDYTGSVDWDAEWKKVVKNQDAMNTRDRPGKDFYKSEAEIAAIVSYYAAEFG